MSANTAILALMSHYCIWPREFRTCLFLASLYASNCKPNRENRRDRSPGGGSGSGFVNTVSSLYICSFCWVVGAKLLTF
jgi:hypothetical protein